MGGPAAKEYPKQYFLASALAATGCYPLWRSAAIGQSGFTVGRVTVPVPSPLARLAAMGGRTSIVIPKSLTPLVAGFLPPYKGAMATVCGMTYARAAIFYLSDWGHDVMVQQYQYDEVSATVLPPLLVSTLVQIINQPIVRATVTLQDPSYHHPNVWTSMKHIYQTQNGISGLWHGTTAGVLKTVPKYCTAIAVKDYAERTLPTPSLLDDSSPETYARMMLLRSAVKSAMAGIAGAALTNPLDVIRNEQFKTNRGLLHTTQALYQELGWKFMIRGLGKNMIAVALPVGVTIFCTETLIHFSESQAQSQS
mmetsp:Transcript_31750/g.35576  ORF Transcript_31750/g.35576 Transcript_31750/m.35576 type:complete len:309 (+) Transcript_31750:158-1084(+)